jgi:anti-anti-sigma regulatory factor
VRDLAGEDLNIIKELQLVRRTSLIVGTGMPLALPYQQSRESMLKITTLIHAETTTFRLEGRLAGPWVQELERCWDSVAGTMTTHPLTIDLSAVTYVDSDGKDLLKKVHRQGARLVASGCLTSCIVNEIVQVARRGERGK